MRVAFVGKGGSGKTTVSALFIRHLAAAGAPVLAVDADINQHLGTALGLSEHRAAELPALSSYTKQLKEYLRGDNPRIASAEQMVKTTPPGHGSRLLRLDDLAPLDEWCAVPLDGGPGADLSTELDAELGGVRLMATGVFNEADLGVSCYHSKVGAAELMLNHLVDGPGEYLVMDMTAGADAFASGLFTRFDVTFLVAEPTRKSLSVYRQYRDYADEYGIAVHVVGNKVADQDDLDFLRAETDGALIAWLGQSGFVRGQERGGPASFGALEPANRAALATLREVVDGTGKDWDRFTELAHHFHRKNAVSWANKSVGADLTGQIDPEFRMGPALAHSLVQSLV
jgi:CO dehydrogenase maturation factor